MYDRIPLPPLRRLASHHKETWMNRRRVVRAFDVVPNQNYLDELVRCRRIGGPNWISWTDVGPADGYGRRYMARCNVRTWLERYVKTGADHFAHKALAEWLFSGPKTFVPTPEQAEALARIDVNLTVDDYSQPFPAVLVEVDEGPYRFVIVYHEPGLLVCSILSNQNRHDITTTVGRTDGFIEDSLRRFDEELQPEAKIAHRCLHIAINACLALSNYDVRTELLLPKEVERDKSLCRRTDEIGLKARRRVALAVQQVHFSQEIKLHKTKRASSSGDPTGRSMPPHWRRGHWRMQAFGPERSLHKRILIPAIFVRSDLFVGELKDTSTVYKG